MTHLSQIKMEFAVNETKPREVGLKDKNGHELHEFDIVLYEVERCGKRVKSRPDTIEFYGLVIWNYARAGFEIIHRLSDKLVRPSHFEFKQLGDYRSLIGQLEAETLTNKHGLHVGGAYPSRNELKCPHVLRVGSMIYPTSMLPDGVHDELDRIRRDYYDCFSPKKTKTSRDG